MADRAIRRFTIIDALALVAAIGLGLAAARCTVADFESEPSPSTRFDHLWPSEDEAGLPWPVQFMVTVPNVFTLAEGSLHALSITLLLLRMRRPRPPWRRMILQPGSIVGYVSFFVLLQSALYLSGVILLCWMFEVNKSEDFFLNKYISVWRFLWIYFLQNNMTVALGIVLVWSLLALARRWRPVPDWIDRGGRVLGALWILSAFSSVALQAGWEIEERLKPTLPVATPLAPLELEPLPPPLLSAPPSPPSTPQPLPPLPTEPFSLDGLFEESSEGSTPGSDDSSPPSSENPSDDRPLPSEDRESP